MLLCWMKIEMAGVHFGLGVSITILTLWNNTITSSHVEAHALLHTVPEVARPLIVAQHRSCQTLFDGAGGV